MTSTLLQYAAVKGISQVAASRNIMAAPGMSKIEKFCPPVLMNVLYFLCALLEVITPFIMEYLEKFKFMRQYRTLLDAPLQTMIVGCL